MLILSNLLITVAGLFSFAINAYSFVIIVSAFMSWCNPNPYNGFVRAISALTEPVFYRLRSRFPFLVFNGLDLTPVALLVVLQLFNGVVVQTMLQLGQRISA
ncbi:MAG: YggT family protein [Desulfovibrio sp.]|nr:YggT family protein [Mailhella sp.]